MSPSLIIVAGGLLPEGWLLRERLAACLESVARRVGSDSPLAALRVGPALPLPVNADDVVPREMAHDRLLRLGGSLPAAMPESAQPGFAQREPAQPASAQPASAQSDLAHVADGVIGAARELTRAGLDARVIELLRERRSGWLVQPAHVLFATDHLRLLDGAVDDLEAGDAQALVNAVQPGFAEHGFELLVVDPGAWLAVPMSANAAPLWSLRCASRDVAAGKALDPYLPAGRDARAFRRLLNESQMIWFDHDVNHRRELAGHAVVNGFWLSGPLDAQIIAQWRDAVSGGHLRFEDRLLAPRLRDDPFEWVEQLPGVLIDLDATLRGSSTAGGSNAGVSKPAVAPRIVLTGDLQARELQPQRAGRAASDGSGRWIADVRHWLRSLMDRERAVAPAARAGGPATPHANAPTNTPINAPTNAPTNTPINAPTNTNTNASTTHAAGAAHGNGLFDATAWVGE